MNSRLGGNLSNVELEPRGTILILTPESPELLGGSEHFIRITRSCLESRNYHVEVIHRANCGIPWKRRSQRKYVAYFQDALIGYFIGRRARQRISATGSNIAAVLSSANVGWYPLQRSIPQLHLYHGTYREQAEAIRPLISTLGYLKQKWLDSMLLEWASGRNKLVLVNSDQTAREVQRYFGHHCRTVWCPLDTAHFRPLDKAECRRAMKIPDDRPVGLFVGNIHPMKGFPTVRALIDRLPEVHWVLALRGELPASPLETAGVQVLHNVTYRDLPLLYASADFSLSSSSYEPFGYVVAESLACGTPVIATPGGASQLFLRESPLRELLIMSASNPEPFLAAIRHLLFNPSLYRDAVLRDARPAIEALMSSSNWCRRFAEISRL